MICVNCGFRLHSIHSHECRLCGMKFHHKCLSCHSMNPLMANYCFNCGDKLIKDESLTSHNNSYILTENRRNIAVLFVDVTGFTALAEKLDPEEVRDIINNCFEFITKPVYTLEGTIDKYMGDCVMVLFGAKYPHSDDPYRAVACGMEMMERIKQFNSQRLYNTETELDICIGISYGLVVTGSVGNYFDKDYTVMGDVVNTAQRLQSIAEKGTILVSESVYLETKDVISYTNGATYHLKNKQNEILAYSPLENLKRNSYEVVTLIERDQQLVSLNDVYKNRNNTICINVFGDAGIGKTTLIKEFSKNSNQNSSEIWVDCIPILRNKAYNVIASIISEILNIGKEESNQIKFRRIKDHVKFALRDKNDEDIIKNYNLLALMMNLEVEKDFKNILNSMNYEDIQNQILKQLIIFFENIATDRSYVIVIDDIQWGDSDSQEILLKLVNSLFQINLVFILISRYEIEVLNSINNDKKYTLQLENLSEGGVQRLASNLIGVDEIHHSLTETLMQFTKGNPSFIKEFINSISRRKQIYIKDHYAYVEQSQLTLIPNTIEGLVMSNLSDLDFTSMSILNIAATVGKEFTLSWVTDLINDKAELENSIDKLIKQGFISLKSVYTTHNLVERILTFDQDVVREVIYDSLLIKNKKELHKRIGELIESKYTNDLDGYFEVLSNHFKAAEEYEKASVYYLKAAIKYKKDFNYGSAMQYFDRFLDSIKSINQSDEIRLRKTRSLIDMGQINTSMGKYELALEFFNQALENATLTDDIYCIRIQISQVYKEKGMFEEALEILNNIQPKIRESSSLFGKLLQMKCSILSILGDSEAINLAQRSEAILLRKKDYENLSETMSQVGILYFIKGDTDNATYYLTKAYGYANDLSNLRLMARVSGNLGIIYHASGFTSKALENFKASIQLADKISDTLTLLSSLMNMGILYLEKGQFNQAEELFNNALLHSKHISSILNQCVSLTNLGDVAYEKGDMDKALTLYNDSLKIAQEHNLPVDEGINYLAIARVYFKQRRNDVFISLLEKSYVILNAAEEISYISDYYRYKSKHELIHNNIQLALEYCKKALSISQEIKNDMKRLKALRLIGIIHSHFKKYNEAMNYLNSSINLAEQLESPYESCKGYYSQYLILKESRKDEATTYLAKAKNSLKEFDEGRWTEIINSQLE